MILHPHSDPRDDPQCAPTCASAYRMITSQLSRCGSPYPPTLFPSVPTARRKKVYGRPTPSFSVAEVICDHAKGFGMCFASWSTGLRLAIQDKAQPVVLRQPFTWSVPSTRGFRYRTLLVSSQQRSSFSLWHNRYSFFHRNRRQQARALGRSQFVSAAALLL